MVKILILLKLIRQIIQFVIENKGQRYKTQMQEYRHLEV